MSQLNAVDKAPSYISRMFEMEGLSSSVGPFITSGGSDDYIKYAETSFIDTPPSYTESAAEAASSDVAEEAAVDASATAVEGLEAGPLAVIGAIKTIGDMTSSTISNSMSTQFSNQNIQNSLAHGVGAIQQTSMINQANQQSLANAQHGMSIGSWFGSLGAYLGYAFSDTNVASSLNMNTAYSTQGMVNPELYDTVATSYASTEASDNQSIISQ